MKYIDADLLRKGIEFAKSVYDNPKRVVHGVADAFRQDGRAAMCDDILKKIDSLQQEQQEEPDKSLEEEISRTYHDGSVTDTEHIDHVAYENIARHFAEWQASQMPMPEDTVLFQKGVAEGKRLMMEEAVEGSVNQDGILELSNGEAIDVCPSLDKCALGLQLGEKVKLIIVKDNDTE